MQRKFRIRFGFSCSDNLKSKTCTELRRSIQNLKSAGIIAIFVTFAMCDVVAQAQQPAKITRIGYLDAVSLSVNAARVEAFRQSLRKLGYVEGKNIFIEWRSADGKLDRLPALAAELVHLKVDIIVTGGRSATRAAKEATSTIPIVMTQETDPVANGFVASLARPGGNITGLSTLAPELSGKQLELMKEIIPKLSRVAVFGSSTSPGNAQSLREVELAARAFKVQLQYLDVLDPKDIETAFRAASNGRADGVLVLNSPVFASRRTQVVDLAVKSRLPAIYYRSEFVEDGGLMSHHNATEAWRSTGAPPESATPPPHPFLITPAQAFGRPNYQAADTAARRTGRRSGGSACAGRWRSGAGPCSARGHSRAHGGAPARRSRSACGPDDRGDRTGHWPVGHDSCNCCRCRRPRGRRFGRLSNLGLALARLFHSPMNRFANRGHLPAIHRSSCPKQANSILCHLRTSSL